VLVENLMAQSTLGECAAVCVAVCVVVCCSVLQCVGEELDGAVYS